MPSLTVLVIRDTEFMEFLDDFFIGEIGEHSLDDGLRVSVFLGAVRGDFFSEEG